MKQLPAKSPFRLVNRLGDQISGDVRMPDVTRRHPVIVLCHSFMAFKDWGFFPFVAEEFARRGFASVSFNFSLNGVAGDGVRITDFGRFERNTIGRELLDVGAVVDGLFDGTVAEGVTDLEHVALVGHSRGGAVALLHSALDRRVKALGTWSSVATFERWTRHQKDLWRSRGVLPLGKDSSVSPLRMGRAFLEEVEARRPELDILRAAGALKIPWLIVHGKEDVTVPPSEGERLYEASDHSRTSLRMLEHVGHLYHAGRREEDGYRTLTRIIDMTTDWIHTQFSKD